MSHLITLLGLFLIATNSSLANTRSITVSGQCETEATPDRAAVTLVAQFTEKTSQLASKKTAEIYEKIRQEVQKLNLKDLELQTTESNLQEQYDYSSSKRASVGFQSSLGLRITTSEIGRIGEVLALTQKLNIQRSEGLLTFLSDEKAKLAREACLVVAVKNAKIKAQKMVEALQTRLGEPLTITEGSGGARPMPMPFYEAAAMADSTRANKVTPAVEAKSVTIAVDVQVQFSIKN